MQWQAKEVDKILEAIRINAERQSDGKNNFPTISKLLMSSSSELSAVLFSRSQKGNNDREEITQKAISIIKLKDQLPNEEFGQEEIKNFIKLSCAKS